MENIARALRRSRKRVPKDNLENNGFLKLFISKRLIQGSAAGLLGIFVPIFLYNEVFDNKFYMVGAYYALLSTVYLLLVVAGMRLMNYIGFSRSLILGGIFSVIIYTIMFLLNPDNVWLYIGPLILAIVGFKIFHWIPFHVDFALFTKNGDRGSKVGLSFATIAFMGVVGPILAGFIIQTAGYEALFATSVTLMIFATISYAFVPETPTVFEWNFKETWQKLLSKDMRHVSLGMFASGAETIINTVVWPIFLFNLLDGNVFEVGAISTVVVGSTIIIQLFLGRHLDKKNGSKERTLKTGSILYAIGWVFKIFVLSAVHVFLVGLYHNIVKIFTRTPFNAIVYDMSSEQGRYLDEFTVVKEMADNAGRVACLIMVSVLSLYISIEWTFVIAAVSSIALNFVYRLRA